MRLFANALLAVTLIVTFGCRIVEDGEVGISKSFGEIKDTPLDTGIYMIFPVVRGVSVWSTKLREAKETAQVPSSEGMMVGLDTTVLWRIPGEAAPELRQTVHGSITETLLIPYLRNGIRDVASGYEVKAIYSDKGRKEIAAQLLAYMQQKLEPKGLEIQDVLLRDVVLPDKFRAAIEAKLNAEQIVAQKQFEVEQAKWDAQKEIERAKGAAESQRIIDATLTDEYLHYLWIMGISDKDTVYVATEAALPIFKRIDKGR
jgi:regulator of protease activity HflC (stomatin/prohibitin superfamily)